MLCSNFEEAIIEIESNIIDKIDVRTNLFSRNKFLQLLSVDAFKFPIWFDAIEKVFYTDIKIKYNILDDLFENYDYDSQNLIKNMLSNNNEYFDPIGGAIE